MTAKRQRGHDGTIHVRFARQRRSALLWATLFAGSVTALVPFRSVANAPQYPQAQVLVLNSYHPQYRWTDRLVEGVVAELAGVMDQEHLHIEYMDTRRRQDDAQYLEALQRFYQQKFKTLRFEVIIVSDDNGLDFLMAYRELFGDAPIVACGINKRDRAGLEAFDNLTGIVEGIEIEGNIELIERLHPDFDKIVAIADGSSFGRSLSDEARIVAAAHLRRGIAFEVWDDFTNASLRERAAQVNERTAFLILAIHKDRDGNYFSYERELPDLAQSTSAPIYGMWGTQLGFGIVGGKLNDPYRHGRNAARLAKRILAGESADDIPVIGKDDYQYRFDYRQLERHGILESALPPGSVIINLPDRLLQRYWWILLFIVLFLLAETLMIIVLVLQQRRLRQAGRTIAGQQSRLILALSAARATIFEIDLRHGRIWLSEPQSDLSSSEGVAFDEWKTTLHEGDAARLELALQELEKPGIDTLDIELRQRVEADDEDFCWILLAGQVMERDAQGRPVKLHGTRRDVSDSRRRDVFVAQAQKMETVGALASGISHDLNNALSGIVGGVSLLTAYMNRHRELLVELSPHLEMLEASAQQATNLTQRLMSIARQRKPASEWVDLNDVLHRVGHLCVASLVTNVRIELLPYPEGAMVLVDPGRLEHALLNLGLNACHAMTSGRSPGAPVGGTLSLGVEQCDVLSTDARLGKNVRPGPYWVIEVRDTGVGMSPKTLRRAFDPFFSTKGEEGTGLGLAMVYAVVQEHRGFIDARSEEGVGTAFSIYLPCAQNL